MAGLVTETQQVSQFGWPAGLNRDAFEIALSGDESPDLLNIDFDLRGAFEPRDGYSRYDTGPLNVASGLFVYTPESGTASLVYIEEGDGSIWAGTTSTLTDTTTGLTTDASEREWHVDAVQLGDYLFVTSLRGDAIRFDGSTWLVITDDDLTGNGDATTPEFPHAMTVAAHYDRVFAGNISIAGGTTHRSRLQWSTLTLGVDQWGGNKWEATKFVDVMEDDGTEIRKIIPFQSNLIIFKDSSLWVLGGSDQDSFSLFRIDPSVGTTAPNSVAATEGRLFFFDPTEGVYLFDGVNAVLIDSAIHNYLLAGINASEAHRAHGWADAERYYLSVPWGADTFNSRTFVFNTRLAAWAEYDYGWYDQVTYNELEYTVGNKNVVGVATFRAGESLDIAAGISWYLNTIWFPTPEGQGMQDHRLRRLDVFSEADSVNFTIEAFVDGDSASAVYTKTVDGSLTRNKLGAYNALWSIIKFKFSGTTT